MVSLRAPLQVSRSHNFPSLHLVGVTFARKTRYILGLNAKYILRFREFQQNFQRWLQLVHVTNVVMGCGRRGRSKHQG